MPGEHLDFRFTYTLTVSALAAYIELAVDLMSSSCSGFNSSVSSNIVEQNDGSIEPDFY